MWASKASSKQVNGHTGQRNSKLPVYLFTFLLVYFLTGCVTLPDPETSQVFDDHTVASLSAGQTAGQTFISRRERLNGLDLWLKPQGNVLLTVELFHSPQDRTPLFTSKIYPNAGQYHFEFPTQADPPNQSYYLKLTAERGTIELLGRNEDSYPNGNAYLDNRPLQADLAFQATYEYEKQAVRADLRGLLSIWDSLIPLAILTILPGWLLLDFTGLKPKFDLGERVGLALGLSLAAMPVVLLWTSLTSLRWGPASAWLAISLLIGLQVWRWLQDTHTHPSSRDTNLFTFILLVAIFALALFIRFAMVRDLAAPAWVDSVHHGLITRLILARGGLPETLIPYLPSGAGHYHPGFHASLAFYIWLTGLEIPTAMLIFGQVLNALMVFPIYLLAKTLTQNRAAAVSAALIVSALTLMPAYYASWGRYTHLVGLLVLPACLVLALQVSPGNSAPWRAPKRLWLLAAITLSGMFLIHYRVTAFWGALLLAYLLTQFKPWQWLPALSRLALLVGLSALFLLPWLPETLTNLLLPVGQKLSTGKAAFSGIPWGFLKPGSGQLVLILAGIGLGLGLIGRKRFPFTILLWTGLMYLMANLAALPKVPGAGFINPLSMEITLFIPLAILGGYAVGSTLRWLDQIIPQPWQITPRVIFTALGVVIGLWGAQRLIPTLNPVTFLAREADFPAIQWIDQNIPAGEAILINPAAWGYGLYMGNDGGYWISALSQHPTLPPPVIYGLGERAEIEHTNQMSAAVQAAGEDPATLWAWMQAENIRYIYIGGRGGPISPQALLQSKLFATRYQQSGTWLFEALPQIP